MENSIKPKLKRPVPTGPMIPDSVYPRKRTSPLSNLQPTMKNHFIPIPVPPKAMLMKRYNPSTSKSVSPFAPSSQFHEEDVEFAKSEKPLPAGMYVGKIERDKYGELAQRVASPVFTGVEQYINPKHTDYGAYEREGHWGIYDTNFRGGRRKKRKTRRTRKIRKTRKVRKTRKNTKSKRRKR